MPLLTTVASGLLAAVAGSGALAADGTAGSTGGDVTQSIGSDTTRNATLTVVGGTGGTGGAGTAGVTFSGGGIFTGVAVGGGTGGMGGRGGIGQANTRSGATDGSASATSTGIGGTGGTGGTGGDGILVSGDSTTLTNMGMATGATGGVGGFGGGGAATATAAISNSVGLALSKANAIIGAGGIGGTGGAGIEFTGTAGTLINDRTLIGGTGGVGGLAESPGPAPGPFANAGASAGAPGGPTASAASGNGAAAAAATDAVSTAAQSAAGAAIGEGSAAATASSGAGPSLGKGETAQANASADAASAGGVGGVGGAGVLISGVATVTNNGIVMGGEGGAGGAGDLAHSGDGGRGGDGGSGLVFANPGSTLTNVGTIIGGSGGLGGAGAGSGANGLSGNGGAGITANGATIDNTGSITGGLADGGAGPQAFAIVLASGTNFVGGTGRIDGGIDVQGTASFQPALPGAPVGRPLTINGPLSFAATSTFAVRLTPGAADSAAVTGVATLNGATVLATVLPGTYTLGTRSTILTATGGVTGRFGGVSALSDLLFLTPTLAYDPNDVYLVIGRNGTSFAAVGATPNQRAAASGIEGIGSGALYDAVLNLTSVAGARAAFDAASGEIHASAVTAGIEGTRLERDAIFDRLDDAARTGGPGALAAVTPFGGPAALPAGAQGYAPVHKGYDMPAPILAPPAPAYTVWGSGFGDFGSNGGNRNAGTLDRSLGGFVAGVDTRVDGTWLSHWRIGVAGGFTHDDLQVRDRASSGSFETYFGGLYAGAHYGAVDIKLGALGGGTGTETRRTVAFAGFSDAAHVGYDGTIAQGFGEIGYTIGLPRGFVEPLFQGAAIHIGQDGFREDGGPAALVGRSRDTDVQTTTFGIKGEAALPFGGLPLIARAFVGYRHAFGDVDPRVVEAFAAGGPAFTIAGAPIDRDAVVADVGLDYRFSQAVTVGISYDGQAGRRANDNAVRGTLQVRF